MKKLFLLSVIAQMFCLPILSFAEQKKSVEEKVEDYVKNFSCKDHDFSMVALVASLMDNSKFQRGDNSRFDLLKSLNSKIASKCPADVLQKCSPNKDQASIDENRGFCQHRYVRGPLEALGISVYHLDYYRGGSSECRSSLEIKVDLDANKVAALCFVRELQ